MYAAMCRIASPVSSSVLVLALIFLYSMISLCFFMFSYSDTVFSRINVYYAGKDYAQLYETYRQEVLAWNTTQYIRKHIVRPASYSKSFFSFNKEQSDRTSPTREVPDTRHPACRYLLYKINEFPTVSIVITFINEARSTLLRTVLSILLRTPKILLEEIILVDDNSTNEEDGSELANLPKVKLFRNSQREGLIRSRLYGAAKASGQMILFLDSHCEVNIGWLEPLVDHIVNNPNTIACPVVDAISANTFEYERTSDNLKGGFDWSLHFQWVEMSTPKPPVDDIQPFESATVPGGIFLIEREWFFTLGGFDPGLEIWGGESLEISLKTWMCNGSLAIIPCSRVGHVFQKRHSYTFPQGNTYTYLRNSKRIVEVWLGEHKRFFYEERPAATVIDVGSLADQHIIRMGLNCKSFLWYMENVYKELRIPNEHYIAFGQLRQGDLCMQADVKQKKLSRLILARCTDNETPSQAWRYSRQTQEITNNQYCLTNLNNSLYLMHCKGSENQKWERTARTIKNVHLDVCIETRETKKVEIFLSKCRNGAITQYWDFSVELEKQKEPRSLGIF